MSAEMLMQAVEMRAGTLAFWSDITPLRDAIGDEIYLEALSIVTDLDGYIDRLIADPDLLGDALEMRLREIRDIRARHEHLMRKTQERVREIADESTEDE